MRTEHAITSLKSIDLIDLAYLVKKANKLGRCGREVIRVFEEQDEEGHHVYFQVQITKTRIAD